MGLTYLIKKTIRQERMPRKAFQNFNRKEEKTDLNELKRLEHGKV